MKKLIILAFCSTSFLSHAQEQDSTNTIKTGFYMSISVLNPSLSRLNQQLRTADLAPLTEGLFGMSLGVTNRFADQNSYGVTRLSVFSSTNDGSIPGQDTRLSVWELSLFGHYDVLPNTNWLIYPYLGLGSSYGRLVVSAVVDGNDFQASLSNLRNEEVIQKKYGSDGFMIFGELGGGIERIVRFNAVNMFIGASVGYRLSSSELWAYKDIKAFDGSAFSTQGLTFDVKFRFELNTNPDKPLSRGLYEFFQ